VKFKSEYYLSFFPYEFEKNFGINTHFRATTLVFVFTSTKGAEMDEEWVTIFEFPMYQVSSLGNVINRNTGRRVSTSLTRQKIVKVALINERGRYTRSVALLVANIFVYGRTDILNTPIHLDGDLQNCEATNLAWRPRWFAYNYHRQFLKNKDSTIDYISELGPVYETNTNMHYKNIAEAAMLNGLLIKEIFQSSNNTGSKRVWPTGQIFEFEDQRLTVKTLSEY
jgi:hypothetical protein